VAPPSQPAACRSHDTHCLILVDDRGHVSAISGFRLFAVRVGVAAPWPIAYHDRE